MDELLYNLLEHHPSLKLAIVIIAYLDVSFRLRFLERIIKKRKILEIKVLGKTVTLRERWFGITGLFNKWNKRTKWNSTLKTTGTEKSQHTTSKKNF